MRTGRENIVRLMTKLPNEKSTELILEDVLVMQAQAAGAPGRHGCWGALEPKPPPLGCLVGGRLTVAVEPHPGRLEECCDHEFICWRYSKGASL